MAKFPQELLNQVMANMTISGDGRASTVITDNDDPIISIASVVADGESYN